MASKRIDYFTFISYCGKFDTYLISSSHLYVTDVAKLNNFIHILQLKRYKASP